MADLPPDEAHAIRKFCAWTKVSEADARAFVEDINRIHAAASAAALSKLRLELSRSRDAYAVLLQEVRWLHKQLAKAERNHS